MQPPIFLCSPEVEQSYVIAKLIKKYQPNRIITGIVMPNEPPSSKLKLIDGYLSNDAIDLILDKGVLIPTGAISTNFYLKKKDIVLGEIKLTQKALKVFDKPWLLDKANSIRIPIPITWDNISSISSYPVFYKQRFEKGGGTRGIAKTKKELFKHLHEDLIFQELIISKGTYGVSFLAKNGEMLCSHLHFESESIPKSGGSAVIIENMSDVKITNYTQKLLKSLNYSGWGLAEYKYCPKRKDYVLMEINAKFWASCELALRNEPAFLKLLFDIDIDVDKEKIQKIIFLDRAIQRGIPFLLKNFYIFFSFKQLRLYPGWRRRIISGIMNKPLFLPLKIALKALL